MDDLSELEWSPEKLNEALREDSDLTLVDVRTESERSTARLEDDCWYPMERLPAALEDLRDETGPVILYCHHGIRSLQAVKFFRQNGLEEAFSLSGGIDAWARRIDESIPTY